MIVLKVRSSRSVSSIVLTRQEMERLKVKEGDKVLLADAPGGYRLTRCDRETERQMQSAEKIMRTDRIILGDLSK